MPVSVGKRRAFSAEGSPLYSYLTATRVNQHGCASFSAGPFPSKEGRRRLGSSEDRMVQAFLGPQSHRRKIALAISAIPVLLPLHALQPRLRPRWPRVAPGPGPQTRRPPPRRAALPEAFIERDGTMCAHRVVKCPHHPLGYSSSDNLTLRVPSTSIPSRLSASRPWCPQWAPSCQW